jgi:NAD+ diphosphatase
MTSAFILENETILCQRTLCQQISVQQIPSQQIPSQRTIGQTDQQTTVGQTLAGWWPLQVMLPDIAETDIAAIASATDDQQSYQLGRVELLESLAPSCWSADHGSNANDYNSANDSDNDSHPNQPNSPATTAITYSYAQNNHIALPVINTDTSFDTETLAFISYRQLLSQLPSALAAQLSQAIQLLRWQADTQFCSRCSNPVRSAKSGERAMVCSVCHLRQYPRVQPCVITAITRPNPETGELQILLAHHHRYGKQTPPLQYGLIAGFVEVGENLEHAVVREVTEEVNISLTDIRYVSSQPWPFPSNLMLGFRACYAGGDIVLQENELSHADFFDISNLPKIPFKGSIAYDLIAQIVHEQGLTL